MQAPETLPVKSVAGRYTLFGAIGAGGMATVHLARRDGAHADVVAIKRVHPHFAHDAELAAMFVDEARIAARVVHPNVVPTLEVVVEAGELFLVMEHVVGESLARLVRATTNASAPIPLRIVSAIMSGVLHGLSAAHRATDERGAPLNVIHRDVSPQNVIVGADGVPRLLDFGIAKASGRSRTTKEGQLRGKLAYMAPEQLGGAASVATDVYAAAVTLWEVLTGKPLYEADSDAALLARVVMGDALPPSTHRSDVPAALDAVVMRGLEREATARFESALAMARALESAVPAASRDEVAAWLSATASEALATRRALLRELDSKPPTAPEMPPAAPARASSDAPRSSPVAAADAGPKRRVLALSLLALAIAVAGAAVTARLASRAPGNAERATPSGSAAEGLTARALAASADAKDSSLEPSAGVPIAVDAPSAIPAPRASSQRAALRPKRSAAASPTSATSAVSCDPPFVIDENSGDRRYKRECLK